MISAAVAIVAAWVIGFPLARWLDPTSRGGVLVGSAGLMGLGTTAILMGVLSLMGLPWTSWSVGAGMLILGIIASVGALLVKKRGLEVDGPAPHGIVERSPVAWIADAMTMITTLGYGMMATVAPSAEYDFVGIWGVKGRLFWQAGGIDWNTLRDPYLSYSHHDYPILLPLILDYLAVAAGYWNDAAIGLLYVAFALATLVMLRSALREATGSAAMASIATLGLTGAACSPYIGIAEGPLIAFGTGAFLVLRRGMRDENSGAVRLGAVLLGLGALSKNEGLAWLVAVAVSFMLAHQKHRWRSLSALWPAAALAMLWIVPRTVLRLSTDLAEGSVINRVWQHLHQLDVYFVTLQTYPIGKPLFWMGVLIALALTAQRAVRLERFGLVSLALQYGFLAGAYLATPNDITWHLRFSAERVINQVTPVLAFTAIVLIAPLMKRTGPPGEPKRGESGISLVETSLDPARPSDKIAPLSGG